MKEIHVYAGDNLVAHRVAMDPTDPVRSVRDFLEDLTCTRIAVDGDPRQSPMMLVYFGKKYYEQSRSVLSSIYHKDGNEYHRYDWGFFFKDLARHKPFIIRKAHPYEIEMMEKKLVWQNLTSNAEEA